MAAVILTMTLFLLTTAGVSTEKVTYKGYQLLSVYPKNIQDAKILNDLGEKYSQLDFWLRPAPERNGTMLVPPDLVQEVKDVVQQQGMSLAVLSDDVQSIMDAGNKRTPEAEVLFRNRASGHVIDHYNYHTYGKIQNYLSRLEAKYCGHIRVFTLNNKTYEGRLISAVKLSDTSGKKKPAIIVEAGIHAREWISPASVLWFMEQVLRDYQARKPAARQMLDKYDWYLVPVINPDGYEYTHTTDRNWRKNRRYVNTNCDGVDLNRNFDVQFGTTGVSSDCGRDIYPGESAFSEPESASIRDLFHNLYHTVVAYVSVHAYSQLVLVPWGYTQNISRPENHVESDRVTKLMTQAISKRHGKEYRHGTAFQLLGYAASGSSADWIMMRKPNVYSVAFELRPKSEAEEGFCLPASEIVPSGEEFYASLKVLAKKMRS